MDQIFKQTSITFLGTILNGLLGVVFYVLVAKLLGPENFGIFVLSISSLTLISDMANLGTDTGLVRFVGKYINSDSKKAYIFLKLSLQIKILVSVAIMLIGWFIAPLIAGSIFQKIELILPLRLAILGVGGAQVFSFALSSFQVLQKFFLWAILQISTNLLRLVLTLLLFMVGLLQIESVILTYILLPLVGFLASLLFLPRDFFRVKTSLVEAKEFFKFSKWVALTLILSAISSKIDLFISGRLLSLEEIGYYGAAIQLVVIVPQIMRAIEAVAAPQMSIMKSKSDALSYFKKSQLYILGLALLGLLAAPIVVYLIPIIYGVEYSVAVPPLFIILLLGSLVFLLTVPVNSLIVYYYGYPKLYSFLSVSNLIITTILGVYLISNFKLTGAALTFLFGNLFNLIVPIIWLFLKVKNER